MAVRFGDPYPSRLLLQRGFIHLFKYVVCVCVCALMCACVARVEGSYLLFCFKDFIYLFLESGKGREKEKNIDQLLLLHAPPGV